MIRWNLRKSTERSNSRKRYELNFHIPYLHCNHSLLSSVTLVTSTSTVLWLVSVVKGKINHACFRSVVRECIAHFHKSAEMTGHLNRAVIFFRR